MSKFQFATSSKAGADLQKNVKATQEILVKASVKSKAAISKPFKKGK